MVAKSNPRRGRRGTESSREATGGPLSLGVPRSVGTRERGRNSPSLRSISSATDFSHRRSRSWRAFLGLRSFFRAFASI